MAGGQLPLDQAKILPPLRSLHHHLLTKLYIVLISKGDVFQYHKWAMECAFGAEGHCIDKGSSS